LDLQHVRLRLNSALFGVAMAGKRIPDAVMRLFAEYFTARDIAEPLASFDNTATSVQVHDFMQANDFDVVGVRSDGRITGFVKRDSLCNGICEQNKYTLADAAVLSDGDPLLRVITELNQAPFLFVTVFGDICGIITHADLQKPAVRMWLFGIVTLIEMRFSELVEQNCPDGAWKEFLSEGRLQKANALLAERSRRNQRLQLLDCLQFSDKGQIVARNEDIRKHTIFQSRRQAEDAIKKLEQLRNNLAHAQDILISDWDTIIQLCQFIEQQELE